MESNTDSRKRALYVNNVTTKDYMRSYLPKHKDSNIFSYITFTYNINGTVHPWNRHGDIFYNGNKLTYINDVCHTDLITDNYSYYLAYFNSDGALDFAQSYIYVESGDNIIRDSYSLYNNIRPELTLNHWTNFRDFVNFNIEENDGWQYDNINDNEIEFNTSGDKLTIVTTARDITRSKHFTISYQFHVDGNSYNDYYDVNFNIYDKITNIELFDFPDEFDVNQIYTPKIKIEPANQLSYYNFNYQVDRTASRFIDVDEYSGRIVCKHPYENATLSCTYYNVTTNEIVGRINKTFKVNKLKNHLHISSTYTAYIWDSVNTDENYSYTVCYVHNYPYFDDDNLSSKLTYEFIGRNGSTGIYSTPLDHSYNLYKRIDYNSNDNKGIYKIGVILNENWYNAHSSYMEIYSNMEITPINSLTFTVLTNDDKTITGVIAAEGITDMQEGKIISSNFKFNSSGKYDNFTITDIVHTDSFTYTYVTANVVSDNNYGIIQITSMDDSLLTYTFEIN